MRRWSTVVLLVLLLAAGSVNGVADDTPLPVAFLPLAGWSYRVIPPPLLISALYYDTFQTNEPDEAFQLYNPLDEAVGLESWQVTDGTRTQTFPRDISLAGHGKLWCAKRGTSFQLAFGFLPGCEYGGDTDPTVPDLPGSALRFANTGGQVTLIAPTGAPQDTLVYEGGDTSAAGWQGPAVYPYKPSTAFGEEGQILYRKLDQSTGWPVADTDTRADWAQETEDIINGRKAQLPGWDLERFFVPQVVTETAGLEVFVAPDHAFTEMRRLLEGTQQSIRFEGYTFESARLGEIVAGRARAGVAVEMILEGSPPGGVSDQQRWVVQQIAAAGGQVYYCRASAAGAHNRYTYQHGKFWVLDGRIALVGSENPNASAFPDDDKADGTFGRRGVYLVTDAPSVVAGLTAVMDADIAPGAHRDVWAWDPADPTLGAPPAGFTPSYASGGIFYPVQKPNPLQITGTLTFQLIHSPEQALRDQDSLLGLVAQAGAGDTLLVEQLYENTYWGAESSNVAADPNPRLLAYIAAARRGATVRVLLDAYFDNQDLNSPRSNLRTVEYLKAVAQAEGLDLDARRRNPTGEGIHNKMILAQVGGQGWVVVGSLNGGEVSAKLNREMALKVASTEAYNYLAELFWYDWGVEP
jgi:phosphatidylserine/phosphatidylglycerophosphate/cardiolipin synthase-like enzyme